MSEPQDADITTQTFCLLANHFLFLITLDKMCIVQPIKQFIKSTALENNGTMVLSFAPSRNLFTIKIKVISKGITCEFIFSLSNLKSIPGIVKKAQSRVFVRKRIFDSIFLIVFLTRGQDQSQPAKVCGVLLFVQSGK